jgi:DNA ligase-1
MKLDPVLTEFIGSDAIFLDTTYCNPKFVFPLQEESIDYVVSVIERVGGDYKGGSNSMRDVLFLVATYVVGKERILLEIARRCNRKIHVDARKMEVLRVLGYGESGLFTEDVCESDVHVVGWNVLGETWPYFRPNFVKMKEIMEERGYSKVVGFVPTGWTYEVKRNKFAVRTKDSFEIHLVPYSEHSNYDELREYVKFLKPKQVIPTVGLDVENLDSKHADKMRKHFAGLVDETANKQEFLRGFYRGSCEMVDRVEKDSSNASNEGLDKENVMKAFEAKGIEINDLCFVLDSSSSLKKPGTQDPVVLNDEDTSSLKQPSSQDPVLLNDEDMEKVIQELRDCLPTWVTQNQILDLINSSGRNIVEAVSNFYERETEFHEQIFACTSPNSVSTSQNSLLNDSTSISKAGFVTSSPVGSVKNSLSKVYKSANIMHSFKSGFSPGKGKRTVDNKPNKKVKVNSIKSGTSPGKRKMNVESKPNKNVKVNSKSRSGGSKQPTITSFFSKVSPDVSQGGNVGTMIEQSPIDENLLPDDSAKFYRDEIDQFIQIINGDVSSRSCAATILEKTKGDINKALDIYFCNPEDGLGDSGKSVLAQSVVNCSPAHKKNVPEKEHVPDISVQSLLRKDVDATLVSLPPEKYNPKEHGWLFYILKLFNILSFLVNIFKF